MNYIIYMPVWCFLLIIIGIAPLMLIIAEAVKELWKKRKRKRQVKDH